MSGQLNPTHAGARRGRVKLVGLLLAAAVATACGISASMLRGLCHDGHCQDCGTTVCACSGKIPCAYTCGSPCDLSCPGVSDCDLSCGHDCEVLCATEGVCAVEVRGGGEIVCAGSGPCGVLCHGPCTLDCVGTGPCNLFCEGKGLSGPHACENGELRCGSCPDTGS